MSGVVLVELSYFFAVHRDARLGRDAFGDTFRELDAVHGQCVAGRDGGGVGFGEEDGAGAAHLLLQEPGRGVFGLGFEGVGADEFGEVRGLVGLGGAHRTHLVEVNLTASFCRLECRFGASETAADDPDPSDCHASPSSLFCVKVFQRNDLRLDLQRKSLISEAAHAQSLPSIGLTCHIAG